MKKKLNNEKNINKRKSITPHNDVNMENTFSSTEDVNADTVNTEAANTEDVNTEAVNTETVDTEMKSEKKYTDEEKKLFNRMFTVYWNGHTSGWE